MTSETNEKVLAMYEAVCELLEEGANLEGIKVSDVTTRAGIGKGTVYEYFRSKEELFVRAINYDFRMQYENLKEMISVSRSLREAMEAGFEWIEQRAGKKRIVAQILELPRLQKLGEQKNVGCLGEQLDRSLIQEIISMVMRIGRKDGSIPDSVPDHLAELEIFTRFMEFLIYLTAGKAVNKEEIQETKEFIYGSMIKGLYNSQKQ